MAEMEKQGFVGRLRKLAEHPAFRHPVLWAYSSLGAAGATAAVHTQAFENVSGLPHAETLVSLMAQDGIAVTGAVMSERMFAASRDDGFENELKKIEADPTRIDHQSRLAAVSGAAEAGGAATAPTFLLGFFHAGIGTNLHAMAAHGSAYVLANALGMAGSRHQGRLQARNEAAARLAPLINVPGTMGLGR